MRESAISPKSNSIKLKKYIGDKEPTLDTLAKSPLVSRSLHPSPAIVTELIPLVKFLGRDFAVALRKISVGIS